LSQDLCEAAFSRPCSCSWECSTNMQQLLHTDWACQMQTANTNSSATSICAPKTAKRLQQPHQQISCCTVVQSFLECRCSSCCKPAGQQDCAVTLCQCHLHHAPATPSCVSQVSWGPAGVYGVVHTRVHLPRELCWRTTGKHRPDYRRGYYKTCTIVYHHQITAGVSSRIVP
jgi:hypothetical protein